MNIPSRFKFKKQFTDDIRNGEVSGKRVFESIGGKLVQSHEILLVKSYLKSGHWIIIEELENAEHLQEVKQEFNQAADDQEKKGLSKYGQPLDPLDNYDWLEMATQEQVDGFKYLIAEKRKREHAIKKIRGILDWLEGGNENE